MREDERVERSAEAAEAVRLEREAQRAEPGRVLDAPGRENSRERYGERLTGERWGRYGPGPRRER
jgi:hypothetical protein